MKHPWRTAAFALGAAGLAGLYLAACAGIPTANERPSRYGQLVNRLALAQRHVTDVVTAVNFDFRGFDTIGEEYILFVSVMGALVLLREAYQKTERDDEEDARTPRREAGPSEAVQLWTLSMTGPTIIFGLYVVGHGQLSPGGGFQGGVILATAPLLIYLADEFKTFKRVISYRLVEVAEAVGAGGYVLIGFLSWFDGEPFLTNLFPLGQTGTMTSGGMLALINLAVGLEVAAGFIVLLHAFMQSSLHDPKSKEKS
ncbi:MAG TPA: MnhB domain-containing protein [Pirellulales bacterium]|jgi:multicomponent Na+:H+ antiporter subunit B|nr:MnhB domain-containing protein [Pirellulales bacterium]